MNGLGLNLAARPFANERPVRRTTLLIWILALMLLAVNVFLYQRHLSAQQEQRQALTDLEERIEAEQAAIEARERELLELQIERQNEEVVFLNEQIAWRTFSWSRLFDRLEEVLPNNVELQRVSPKILKERRRGHRRDSRLKDLVAIDLRGSARTTDEILELVDNLFAHPVFTLPNLMGESERDDGSLEFNLEVLYLPTVQVAETNETAAAEQRPEAAVDPPPGGEG